MQKFRIWINHNTKYCTLKLIFFQLLHAVLPHQTLLVKDEKGWQNKYLFISKCGKISKPLKTRLHIIPEIKSKTRRKLENLRKACKRRFSKFKISQLITSFSTSSPGFLAFTMLLMTTKVFFIVISIGKVTDLETLSYLTDNS